MSNIWTYGPDSGRDLQAAIIGYDVEAVDGGIGEITQESTATDDSHIVVDTGFWILEKKRMIPAGAISRVDHANSKVKLSMTKAEVKDAPDYVDVPGPEREDYREQLATFYHPWMGL